MTRWQKERLAEQLKFFGAKKTKFISVYARKPRILCKVKVKAERQEQSGLDQQRALQELYNAQYLRGTQNSFLGLAQTSQLQAMTQAGSMAVASGLMGMVNGTDLNGQDSYIPYLGGWAG
jgi:hypothetical protein